MARLPSQVRQKLQALLKMDDMTLGQLLTRACAIMSAEKEEPVAVTSQPVKANTSLTSTDKSASQVVVRYYQCFGLNHFARDCQYQQGEGFSGPT